MMNKFEFARKQWKRLFARTRRKREIAPDASYVVEPVFDEAEIVYGTSNLIN